MMSRITNYWRDFVWLIVVVALGFGWRRDHLDWQQRVAQAEQHVAQKLGQQIAYRQEMQILTATLSQRLKAMREQQELLLFQRAKPVQMPNPDDFPIDRTKPPSR